MIYVTDPKLRRTNRMFLLLAEAIVSKSAVQVKSHHQKLMKKYGNVEKILLALERRICKE